MNRVLLIACLLAATLSVPAVAEFTASGTFLYEDRPFTIDGFTGDLVLLPVRHADVEVVDLLTQTVVGAGRTGADGTFEVTAFLPVPRTIYVRCLTGSTSHPDLNLQVLNDGQEQALYALAGPAVPGHDPGTDLDCGTLVAAAGASGEAFNVFDAAVHAIEYFHALSGEYPGPAWDLTLLWSDGAGESSCWYDDVYRQVILADDAGYDDSIILHETGHYVQSAFALCQSPGGAHYVTDMNQDARLAFSEGWATYFSAAVRLYHGEPGAQVFTRTTGGSGAGQLDYSFELEGPSLPVLGSFNELAVSACLWDLVDTARHESGHMLLDDDEVGGQDLRVWGVLSGELPGLGEATMEAFWDGWLSTGDDLLAGVQTIFSGLGMEYAADTWEPADSKIAGAVELGVAAPGPQARVVVNELALGAVDWLELYNGGGTAVDLAGWTVRAGRSSGSVAEVVLPTFILHPHHCVTLYEGNGENGVDRVFLPGTNIPWTTSGDGFCSLLDDGGSGVDFCRWGGSSEAPPAGTAWAGTDPAAPWAGMNLGRDSGGGDTDQGSDFTPQPPTASSSNWDPGGGVYHHSFYPAEDIDWQFVQAQAGQRYDLEVFNRCSGAGAVMTLYAPDGITALFEEGSEGRFGAGPRRAWVAPADGAYPLSLTSDGIPARYGSYDLRATEIPSALPSVQSVAPSVVGSGATCPVTITGDGFVPGLTVDVSSQEVACRWVEVLDRGTAVLQVDTTSAATTGLVDLTLLGPNGSSVTVTGALAVDPGRGTVVVNEVNVLENWIELVNIGNAVADLGAWEIRVASGGGMVTGTLPPASIAPGSRMLLYDLATPGENGPAELHLDCAFGWGAGSYGSVALVDEAGGGRDFVRWDGETGSSMNTPPPGTGWHGSNPLLTGELHSLGRSRGGTDTDAGCDFCAQAATPGGVNEAPAALAFDLAPVTIGWFSGPDTRQLDAAGGDPPYRWFVSPGIPPSGFSLSRDGLVRGAPLEIGSWPVGVSVYDSVGRRFTGELLFEVDPQLSSSMVVDPAEASFPCNVSLDIDLHSASAVDVTVEARLTASGLPPQGGETHTIAHSVLNLPAGQARHFLLTFDIPDREQFASGVQFRLTLEDPVSGVPLDSCQRTVWNQHQLQHRHGGMDDLSGGQSRSR